MNAFVEWIQQPWPWYVAGPMITLVMFLLLWFGKGFGVSSTLRTACAMGGGGKVASFFKFDWKGQIWNIVFVIGGLAGGAIAAFWLSSPEPLTLNPKTVAQLQALGVQAPTNGYLPQNLFNWQFLTTAPGLLMIVGGGFLVGFGTRYAGGCTSGHAISGLSNLQWPSLVAVVGFFIGGLAMTHFLMPLLLG